MYGCACQLTDWLCVAAVAKTVGMRFARIKQEMQDLMDTLVRHPALLAQYSKALSAQNEDEWVRAD